MNNEALALCCINHGDARFKRLSALVDLQVASEAERELRSDLDDEPENEPGTNSRQCRMQ